MPDMPCSLLTYPTSSGRRSNGTACGEPTGRSFSLTTAPFSSSSNWREDELDVIPLQQVLLQRVSWLPLLFYALRHDEQPSYDIAHFPF